jgi:hypothetical protein
MVFGFIEDLVTDPVRTVTRTALSPVRDSLDVLQGLSEGEIRHRAALRLGADVVAGMAMSEIIEALSE